MSLTLERARQILHLSIERARETLPRSGESPDFRDALCLQLERCGWATLEIARHWVYEERLGMPKKEIEVFEILRGCGWLSTEMGRRLKQCAEYRLLSSRDLERLDWPALTAAVAVDLQLFEQWLKESFLFPLRRPEPRAKGP